jgi:hypothetical protein
VQFHISSLRNKAFDRREGRGEEERRGISKDGLLILSQQAQTLRGIVLLLGKSVSVFK